MNNLKKEICSHIINYFNKEENFSGKKINFEDFDQNIYSSKLIKDDFCLKIFYFKIPEDVVIISYEDIIVGLCNDIILFLNNNVWLDMTIKQSADLLSLIESLVDLFIKPIKNEVIQNDQDIIMNYIDYIFDRLENNGQEKA